MVKGCQKKTIHIKDTGSKYYEEAYFILRPGVFEPKSGDRDMIREAIRIAEESMDSVSGKRRGGSGARGAVCFVLGAFAGAIAAFLCFAVIL
ncbi:MAG: hypothetical protein IJT70_06135 [Clostridia bacterium]|nr:hypothetical protein [Clostridia bacterium]